MMRRGSKEKKTLELYLERCEEFTQQTEAE